MIYIEEGQKIPLPKKFHKINNLCAIIYDQLTEILTDDLYRPLTTTSINFSNINTEESEKLDDPDTDIYDFLVRNGLSSELDKVLTKHVTMSILSDFTNFVYESISCAQRGKMEVAYSLLRKPFIDELLMFEQILIDKTEFINRYYHIGDPKQYDPSSRTLDRRSIIQKALIKLKRTHFLSEDVIFTLRYDKSSPSGINGLSNQALHIVTTDPNYRTGNQELNFVFSDKKDYSRYWEHYYYFVPILLLYSVAIIDEILFEYLDEDVAKAHKFVKELKRIVAFLIISDRVKKRKSKKLNLDDTYLSLGKVLKFKCENCKKESEFSRVDFELFFEMENFLCSSCGEPLLGSDDSIDRLILFSDSI